MKVLKDQNRSNLYIVLNTDKIVVALVGQANQLALVRRNSWKHKHGFHSDFHPIRLLLETSFSEAGIVQAFGMA